MTRVVGLDLSTTSAGVSDCVTWFAVQPPELTRVEDRILMILAKVWEFVEESSVYGARHERADLVVIEGPAVSLQTRPGAEELSGIRVMTRCMLADHKIPFALVTPSTLKLYTAGHGKATKAQMVKSLEERHGLKLNGVVKVSHGRDDMADAYALAAMGYHRLGHQIPSEGPPPPLKSLLAVPWPEPLPVTD